MPRKRRRARSLRGRSVLAERCVVPRSAAVAERHQSCGVKSLEVLAEVAEDPKFRPSLSTMLWQGLPKVTGFSIVLCTATMSTVYPLYSLFT